MKVIDLLEICKGAPYVRIIAGNRDGEILAGGYVTLLHNMQLNKELAQYYDALVLEFFARYEVTHKQYKELGFCRRTAPTLRRNMNLRICSRLYITTLSSRDSGGSR